MSTTATVAPAPGDEVLLEGWARDRGLRTRVLLEAARAGRFPPVVEISQRVHLVSLAAIAEWRQRRAVSPATAGMNPAFLDSTPAEPFAEQVAGERPAAAGARKARRRPRCVANAEPKVAATRATPKTRRGRRGRR